MAGFIEGVDRCQSRLFPERLDDWVGEDHLVRVVDLFVEKLDFSDLGFERTAPARTGRPGYHPAVLLKLFIYGYLNRVPSSRRLEREAGRNVELMWLTGRLAPDHKTIADFRRDNGPAIRKTCAQFVELCRRIGVLRGACVAIDGSKFKAVNNRDRNFTKGKIANRLAHLEADAGRYMDAMARDRPSGGRRGAGRESGPLGTPVWPHPTGDLAPEGHGAGLGGRAGRPDLADRPGCPRNGDQRPAQRARRLQRPGRGRHRDPPDRHPRRDEPGLRPRPAGPDGDGSQDGARRRRPARHCRQGLLQRLRDHRLPRSRHHHDRAAPRTSGNRSKGMFA
jgi:transposase